MYVFHLFIQVFFGTGALTLSNFLVFFLLVPPTIPCWLFQAAVFVCLRCSHLFIWRWDGASVNDEFVKLEYKIKIDNIHTFVCIKTHNLYAKFVT